MTITLTREEAQQVLDALEWNLPVIEDFGDKEQLHKQHKSIETLRARLAQPEPYKQPEDNRLLMQAYRAVRKKQPEPAPVAWMLTELDGTPLIDCGDLVVKQRPVLVSDKTDCIPLYTAPPQREWQGLTDEEMRETLRPFDRGSSFSEKIRTIEAKLKEKNI